MKRNAIVRIVIYSFAIVLITGILLVGLGIISPQIDINEETAGYISGPGSVDSQSVKSLNIQWPVGSVEIITGNTDYITFSEANSGRNVMAYKLEGDVLKIRYQKSDFPTKLLMTTAKTLTVTIPLFWMCDNLSLEVDAADVKVDSVTAERVTLVSTSGGAEFQSCYITNLKINSESGQVDYTGSMKYLDSKTNSADFIGVFNNSPNQMYMETVSGNLDIKVPREGGFFLTMDTTSGKLYSDKDFLKVNNKYNCYGEGISFINYKSTSGNVRIFNGI